MQSTAEGILMNNLLQNHLVKINDDTFSIKNIEGSWGKMNKKTLLVSKPNVSVESDTELLKKVITLTQDYEADDFFYLPIHQKFPSLLSLIEFAGAENILFFNIKPSDVSLYQQGIVDLPFHHNQTKIVFFPIVEQCVTNAEYKRHFAAVWLKMLNTSWIKK
ncbi:MAG: hypothetical protein RJA07_2508 [Bacteroidota bacterium]|jgi:hypothetical protein